MIGVVCGLASEADIVREVLGDAVKVRVSGASSARAGYLAQELTKSGARELWSIGVSGGLAPGLYPGTLVIGAAVIEPNGAKVTCAPSLVAKLQDYLGPDAATVTLAGSDTLASLPRQKAELGRTFGADAVDMESHAVARAAQTSLVSFAAVRAIADGVSDTLPAVAAHAVGPNGRPKVGAVLAGLARRPGDIPALIRLARASSKAHAALRRGLLVLNAAGVFAR